MSISFFFIFNDRIFLDRIETIFYDFDIQKKVLVVTTRTDGLQWHAKQELNPQPSDSKSDTLSS